LGGVEMSASDRRAGFGGPERRLHPCCGLALPIALGGGRDATREQSANAFTTGGKLASHDQTAANGNRARQIMKARHPAVGLVQPVHDVGDSG
jgi:hypothetical protein